jgi:hypothetical protein
MMKTVQSQMYVYTSNPYGVAYDIDTLNEILNELANEHGENAMKEARILNVTHEVPRADVFPLKYVEGELLMNGACYGRDEEGTFVLHDYNDKEFDSEDELTEFIREEVKSGMLTLEEAKCLDITYKQLTMVSFDDAEQEDGGWQIDVNAFEEKHRVAMDAMAIEYVNAYEASKEVRQLKTELTAELEALKSSEEEKVVTVIPMNTKVVQMTDAELNAELFAMLDRVNEIQQEKRRRESK